MVIKLKRMNVRMSVLLPPSLHTHDHVTVLTPRQSMNSTVFSPKGFLLLVPLFNQYLTEIQNQN